MAKAKKRRTRLKLSPASVLDLTYRRAAKFITQPYKKVHILVVGCGGTGSQLAPAVASLVYTLNSIDRPTSLTFIDYDRVEQKNIGRQNFVKPDLNRNKAVTLAARYGHAYGFEAEAFTKRFSEYGGKDDRETLVIMVGCVDNPDARRDMAAALDKNPFGARQVLWLDCGNLRYSGKVYFGSTNKKEYLRQSFPMPQTCVALPSVALLQPKLLEPEQPEDVDFGLDCADLVNLQMQSLNVNRITAIIAVEYLTQLLLDRDLKCFATYYDLRSFSMRTDYIHPDNVGRLTNMRSTSLSRRAPKEKLPGAKAA